MAKKQFFEGSALERAEAFFGRPIEAAQDPDRARVDQQLVQLGAARPLRPGDRAPQADVDGLALFDVGRSPSLF